MEVLEILSQRNYLESCGDVSWERLVEESEDLSGCESASGELVRAVSGGSDVIGVSVSLSSLITELCDVFPCRSDGEFVERANFSFFKKRAHWCTNTREEMRYEDSAVITSPLSTRRMTSSASVQNSYISFEGPMKVRRRMKRMKCERKNNHREDKTVSGKKFQCEWAWKNWKDCWDQKMLMWISDES